MYKDKDCIKIKDKDISKELLCNNFVTWTQLKCYKWQQKEHLERISDWPNEFVNINI